jgi:hypothetical protein
MSAVHQRGHSAEIAMPTAEMTADWAQWAMHLPTNDGANAFEDTTGAYADSGLVAPDLLFLAGAMGSTYNPDTQSTVVERVITVTEGTDILIPVLNITESLPDYQYFFADPAATPDDVTAFLHTYRDEWVQTVFLRVDGHKIIDIDNTKNNPKDLGEEYWVESPFFSFGDTDGQSFQPGELAYDLGAFMPQDVVHDNAKIGGWWALLEDLDPGKHKIEFGGSMDFTGDGVSDFSLDITDIIYVVPAGDCVFA